MTVLLLEDLNDHALLIETLLDRQYEGRVRVDRCETSEELQEALDGQKYDVALVDLMMPALSYADAIPKVARADIPVVILTNADCEVALRAMELGADALIMKLHLHHERKLRETIDKVLRNRQLLRSMKAALHNAVD